MDSNKDDLPDLSGDEKKLLLVSARKTLQEFLKTGKILPHKTKSRALLQPRAVFVTLSDRKTNDLRGCRGETVAKNPLIEAVSKMAIASAIDDPRFPSVEFDELENLRIEINVLTPMRKINPAEIVVGKHGLMIIRNHRAGLLLPQVPVHYKWNKQTFLKHLCKKAGLPVEAWQEDETELYAFESEEWGEE